LDKIELEKRTRKFAVAAVRFVSGLGRDPASQVLGRQLIRAATSIGANYREANRAESRADFIHKMSLVEKEAAETEYWLEVMMEADMVDSDSAMPLIREANEFVRLFNRAGRTARAGGKSHSVKLSK